MEYKLIPGRPDDFGSRIPKEQRVYEKLDELNISYERIDHEPLMTMEACAEVDKYINAHICKNLLLCNQQKTQFYMLMMPGDKKFKTKDLSAQIGSARLSFADAEYMERFLDITPGSLSVFGLMNDHDNSVRLLIDSDTLHADYIGAHPCINTSSLRLKMKDLTQVFLPAVGHDYTEIYLKYPEE